MSENASNLQEWTVGEISLRLKRSVEDAFGLVRVRGEISGFKRAGSGHLYLTLKDDQAVLDAVCWRGTAARLGVMPEDGMEVVCIGKLTTFPGRSKYQMVIERMELAGLGALMALLEQRRQALAAEGLFAAERKRPLPYLPAVIGVVTSPTGAVIRDILHRLRERFPCHVLVWPVLVQGDAAAGQVAAAIRGFDAIAPGGPVPRPDVLIVARGGGSLEDLWAFNEEIVVRAAADCRIPLISAVGHETDTTLIDHASDRRAPTPTAAAEIAVPVRLDLAEDLASLGSRGDAAVRRRAQGARQRLADLARGLRGPRELLALAQQRHDELAERLPRAARAALAERRAALAAGSAGLRPAILSREVARLDDRLQATARRLDGAASRLLPPRRDALVRQLRLLDSLSYRSVLARGFALVHGPDGPVHRAAGIEPGGRLVLEFADGRRDVRAEGPAASPGTAGAPEDAAATGPRPRRPAPAGGAAPPPAPKAGGGRQQGELF
ncbi:MAG: exodeoxyribonuclease VII large subunit [Sneathiellaceae bacterium]